MSRYLLDTHTLIWWLEGAPLPKAVRDAISAPRNEIHVSAASAYEIAFKMTVGKLPSAAPLVPIYARTLLAEGFRELDVTTQHSIEAGRLPLINRDPFDRILAAQSIAEDLPILSNDAALTALGAMRVW